MTLQLMVSIFACLISTVALVFTAATFFRAGRWNESGEAKAIEKRFNAIEKKVDEHAVQLRDIPTKADLVKMSAEFGADIARLEANVENLGDRIGGVDAGVTRIEQFLMSGATR
jgi:hypothetical protein